MSKALESFAIVPTSDGYLLQIEDADGETIELTASFDQLDLISEEIDRQLNSDEEEELEVDPSEEPEAE